jgi:hypothetical protein
MVFGDMAVEVRGPSLGNSRGLPSTENPFKMYFEGKIELRRRPFSFPLTISPLNGFLVSPPPRPAFAAPPRFCGTFGEFPGTFSMSFRGFSGTFGHFAWISAFGQALLPPLPATTAVSEISGHFSWAFCPVGSAHPAPANLSTHPTPILPRARSAEIFRVPLPSSPITNPPMPIHHLCLSPTPPYPSADSRVIVQPCISVRSPLDPDQQIILKQCLPIVRQCSILPPRRSHSAHSLCIPHSIPPRPSNPALARLPETAASFDPPRPASNPCPLPRLQSPRQPLPDCGLPRS